MKGDVDVWRDRQQNYFEQKKKGQINEIKNMLNKIINEPDDRKGREVIKKVIGYMTLGLDASPIFSQMCRASYTNDEIQKKMIYFYLTTYAEENPDLSVMVINTFKKDCEHTKYKIRGMALRNLCNFKTVDYVDNVLPVLRVALVDHESYVKKIAVFGCLKLFYFDNEAVLGDNQILQKLSFLIKDPDPIVSFNALVALNEIKIAEGGIPMSNKLTMYLLKRLEDYNQWGQTTILEYVYKYNPKDQKQLFDILNILENRLKNSCTALVFSAIKIFLKYTNEKQHLFAQVIERIKSPMLTLMTSSYSNGTFETSYVILQHILDVIVNMNGKACFENDFKYFYFRADQPTYLKDIKMKILTELASQNNLGDMLNELNEYVMDQNIQTSRKAIQSLTKIALKLKDVTKALMKNLLEFYRSNKSHLVNQTVIAFQQILRKVPRQFSEIKDHLEKQKDLINQPDSIFSFVWLLGSFGQHIKSSPYILEALLSTSQQFEKNSPKVQSILLTSIVTLFLKRAPQTFAILQKIFGYIFNNQHISVDLKDRAAFYYRAMQANIEDVKKGFVQVRQDLSIIPQKKNILNFNIDQFNTLSLIYQKPEHKFIKPYEYFIGIRRGNDTTEAAQTQEVDDNNEQPQVIVQALDPEDILEFGQYEFEQQTFQQLWQQLSQVASVSKTTNQQDVITQQNMEQLFKMWKIYNMAYSAQDDTQMFYLYSKHNTGTIVLFQLSVNKSTHTLTLNVKCSNNSLATLYVDYISEFLTLNEIVQ